MTLQIGWRHDPAKITQKWRHEPANWQAEELAKAGELLVDRSSLNLPEPSEAIVESARVVDTIECLEERTNVRGEITLIGAARQFAQLGADFGEPEGPKLFDGAFASGLDALVASLTRNNLREDDRCLLLSLSKISSACGFEDRSAAIGEADVMDSGFGVGPEAGTRRSSSH